MTFVSCVYLVPKSKFLLFSGIWDANTEQAGGDKETSARATMMRWWMLLVLTAWSFGNILHVHTSPEIITYLMLKLQLKFKSVCLASWNIDVAQATCAPLGLVNVILGWWFAQVKGRGCTPGAWWIDSWGIANVASPKPSKTADRVEMCLLLHL